MRSKLFIIIGAISLVACDGASVNPPLPDMSGPGQPDMTGLCTPGATQCDKNTLQTCDNTGKWNAGTLCADQVCVNGACTGQCSSGATRCLDDKTQQECDDAGTWGSNFTCANACAGSNCGGVCSPGDTQCTDAWTRLTCQTDGQWDTGTACNFACVGTACAGVCVPGTIECPTSTPPNSKERSCNSTGNWDPSTSGATCTNQTCVAGVGCTGECAPNQKQCLDSTHWQSCGTDGMFTDNNACTGATPVCITGGTCGTCTAGDHGCTSNRPQLCSGNPGSWGWAGSTCVDKTCFTAGDTCQGVCSPDEVRCVNNGPQKCTSAGQWPTISRLCFNSACTITGGAPGCGTPSTCNKGGTTSCAGVCTPGTKRCSGGYAVQTCTSAGTWPMKTLLCADNEICSGAGVCTLLVCGKPLTVCHHTCVNTRTDNNNCHGCGNVINPQTDPANCGGCGNVCPCNCTAGVCTGGLNC